MPEPADRLEAVTRRILCGHVRALRDRYKKEGKFLMVEVLEAMFEECFRGGETW